MNAHLFLSVFLAAWAALAGLRAESLAESDAKYEASREKIEFDALAQEEASFAAYGKRLDGLLATEQKAGNLSAILEIKEESTRLAAEKAPAAAPKPPQTPLGREMAAFAGTYGKIQSARADAQAKLKVSYGKYLETRQKESTKAGNFAEATAYMNRIGELASGLPPATLPAPTVTPAVSVTGAQPVGPPPPATRPGRAETPEQRVQRWIKESGLILYRGGKLREVENLLVEEHPDGFHLHTPKHPTAQYKMGLGGGPLQVGDRIRIEGTNLYTIEFISPSEPGDAAGFAPAPDKPCEVEFRRTPSGYEMKVDGKVRSSFARYGLASKDEKAFWSGEILAAVTFIDVKNPILNKVEIDKAPTR